MSLLSVVTVNFTEAEYSVQEGGDGVRVTVVLSGNTEREVAVDVFTSADTASGEPRYGGTYGAAE